MRTIRRSSHATRLRFGYTLVEVLTASIIIGMAMTAAVSMSSTIMLQEELSWRVSVGLNHQENAARLFQLGLDKDDIRNLMPNSVLLDEILVELSPNKHFDTSNSSSAADPLAGALEKATTTATLKNFTSSRTGSTTVTEMYRPTIR